MKPEDIPAEWVEKAARAVVDELGACAMCGESGPAGCVYCKDDAEQHARAALAAVLPEALAEALAKYLDAYVEAQPRMGDSNAAFAVLREMAAEVNRLREGSES
jgi:hypothetical protein